MTSVTVFSVCFSACVSEKPQSIQFFDNAFSERLAWSIIMYHTDSTECGGKARHWCSPMRSYHSGAETAPLVVCETENWFQIGGACLQVIAWSCFAVPVGRLSTCHKRETSTSQVFQSLHVWRPTDTVTDWQQEFLCSRTAAMEQPTDRDPEERYYIQTL